MNKTHAGAKKRFTVTRRGRVRCRKAGKSHLLSKKSSSRKRRLTGKKVLGFADAQRVRIALNG